MNTKIQTLVFFTFLLVSANSYAFANRIGISSETNGVIATALCAAALFRWLQ